MSANDLLMQFQADMLGVPVIRPRWPRRPRWAPRMPAGLAVGDWQDVDDLRANWAEDRRWLPEISKLIGKGSTPAGRRR